MTISMCHVSGDMCRN